MLGAQLDAHLACAARALRPVAAQLARRLDQRLRQWGYSLRERRALLAVAPASIGRAARGLTAETFLETVEYSGRRLAKLNVSPRRLLRALGECRRQAQAAGRTLGPSAGARLAAALEQWYVAAALTLNNAFHQVADAEAQACHELFRHELQSAGLDELLARLLESLTSFCRADAGQLFLAGPERGSWVLRAQAGREPGRGRLHCGGAVGVPPRAVLTRPRCSMRRGGRPCLALDAGWREFYHTCWSVPLASGGRLKGVMQFGFSKPYEWLPRELEILSVAAERCLLAAGKARLAEQLAAREAQIRELAGRVAQAEEGERRRISSELHDEAGQSLLCVRLQLELLERSLPAGAGTLRQGLAEARQLTEKTIVEIRRLVAALSPAVLDQLGLARALRQLASQVARLHRIEVRCVLGSLGDVPKPIAQAAYRLAQEGLNNAARHSRASRINLSAQTADGQLRLCVEDNGVGFRVREAMAAGGSFGLAGMSERVRLLGGELKVRSRPGQGAAVAITLPIRPAAAPHRLGVE